MQLNCFASDLVEQFFIKLNDENLRYAVLRNYELLPEINESKDVDILVSPDDFNYVIASIKITAKRNDYQLIWINELDYLSGLVFTKIDGFIVKSIKLDIFNGFKWRGFTYIDHDVILNAASDFNGFKVPLKAHEAFIMIIYYILYAKKIKSKYLAPIYENAINNADNFKNITEHTFNSELAGVVIDHVKNNKINNLISLRPKIRSNVILNSFKEGKIVACFLKHLKTEYWDRNKFGFLIVFSGPDGAGKSTLVNSVMDVFYSLGITSKKTPHHFLSSKIPSLHKLPVAPKKYAKQDYTKPYQARTAGLISSFIRTIYYYVAFLFDRLVFLKKELRANEIVVFDRYFTDLIVDPARIRIGLSKSIVKRIFQTLPAPDLTVVIVADTDQIFQRKDELTKLKLVELLQEYSNLPSSYPNCQILNNNGSIEEGKLDAYKSVFNLLEKKYG